MQKINDYLFEKFKLDSKVNYREAKIPKTKEELISIIKEEIKRSKDANLNFIDTSQINDMSSLFDNLNVGDIYINEWDVSNVKNMDYMFWQNPNFNADISNWDVRNVESMRHAFDGCKKFNCDLKDWRVESLKNCRGIFEDCDSLENIPDWAKRK